MRKSHIPLYLSDIYGDSKFNMMLTIKEIVVLSAISEEKREREDSDGVF